MVHDIYHDVLIRVHLIYSNVERRTAYEKL